MEGCFMFRWEGGCFLDGGFIFKWGVHSWGALVLMGGFRKYHMAASPHAPPLWETLKGIIALPI